MRRTPHNPQTWLNDVMTYTLRRHVEESLREALRDRGVKILYLRAEYPVSYEGRVIVKWGCEYRPHEHAEGQYYEGQEEFTLADVFGIAMGIHYGKPPI